MTRIQKNILVTGSNGQLGCEIRQLAARFQKFNFLFTTREQLSLDDAPALKHIFEGTQIHYCINCAAYTAVDKAEEDKKTAFLINATSVGNLAKICKQYQAKLIHISTDYVFDGKSGIPLREVDMVAPLNVYGASKLQGEELALNNNDQTFILRTSWVYSSFGNNFVKTIVRICGQGKELNIINDQFGCPTFAGNIAAVIMQVVEACESGAVLSGIYHYCDCGITSWYEFAGMIKQFAGLSCQINPTTTAQYVTAAERPRYSVLDTGKLQSALQIEIPTWQESLRKCISALGK